MSSKKVLDIDVDYTVKEQEVKEVYELAKEKAEKERKNSFPLRPSSALKPDLDLYLDLVNYFDPGTIPKDEMEGRVNILLESGHVLEDFIVEQYGRVNKITATNQKVTYATLDMPDGTTRDLEGEYDFTFIDKETGKEMLGDSKTSADFAFKATEKPMYGKGPALPKEEHFAQLNLYMHSPEFKKRGIDTARIVYYNKNNSAYFVTEFKYNEELAFATLDRFQKILDMYGRKEMPEQEHFWGHHWKATYGSYRTHLHKQYKAAKNEREILDVSETDFENVTSGPTAGCIYKYAKTYGTKRIKTQSGKSAYMSLTKGGLIVRVTGDKGFTKL